MKRDCRCPRARHQHGTRAAFMRDRCRCTPCRVANARASLAYFRGETFRERPTLHPCGTQRRLRALHAIGWTWQALSAHTGTSASAVSQLAGSGQRKAVTPETAAKVRAIYDRLWDVFPEGASADRARSYAARKRWMPPLAWDDDTIDDPAARSHCYAQGATYHLTRAERAETVARLTRAGLSAAQIAVRLGITERMVTRDRAKGAAA
jgi:DNA-binding CsgD family transcriptional regulator